MCSRRKLAGAGQTCLQGEKKIGVPRAVVGWSREEGGEEGESKGEGKGKVRSSQRSDWKGH